MNSRSKYVKYSTINDENKYKSKNHLFISKTTIMLNKCEKNLLYNFYFRQTDILFLSFFLSFILSLSFYSFLLFSPTFFVLILSYLSGTCTFFFCRHMWAELSLLFWTFLSGTFSQGGCTCTQCTPLRTRLRSSHYIKNIRTDYGKFNIHVAAATIWRNLNDNIEDLSQKLFKTNIKLSILQSYNLIIFFKIILSLESSSGATKFSCCHCIIFIYCYFTYLFIYLFIYLCIYLSMYFS